MSAGLARPGSRGRRSALAGAVAIALAACSGVPMRTAAKLAIAGPDEILGADPRDLRVAIDVDTRVKPQPGIVPVLDVALVADSGTKRDWSLPLVADPASSGVGDLRLPRGGRHWLVWRLPEQGVHDFREMQALVKPMLAKSSIHSLLIRVNQDWIDESSPAFRQDRIAIWVRTRAADGYYELWSGRASEAMRQRT